MITDAQQSPGPRIRKAATRQDGRALIGLIRKLAEFERLAGPDDAAAERFLYDGFVRQPPSFDAYLMETAQGEAIGYLLLFQTYSTFLCRPSLYIEDLFVMPEHRGRGCGKLLLEFCLALARARGCGRVEWTVLDWNTSAQEFYKSFGAKHLSEWLLYRVTVDQSVLGQNK